MSKIGDLLVRLRLKGDDYKKGLSDAKKDTQGFSNALTKMKAGAVAVWAAVGAGVTKLSGDVIRATNAMSDAFDQMTSSWKASYHNALAEVSSKSSKGGWLRFFNLSNPKAAQELGANAKAAGKAAAEATKAFDQEFELVNSVRLQKQAIQKELNELYIAMRDTTLSGADRQAAANKYKALLQPIADAEVKVYGDMLQAAVTQWQTGVDLDRVYSVDEMTEFFSKIGVEYDKMAQKFPELMRVYETRKGDKQNQPIFDLIATYQQASNQMSNVDKEMARTTNSIKASIHRSLEDIAKEVETYGQEDLQLDLSIDVDLEEIDMSDADAILDQFTSKLQEKQLEIANLNQMIEGAFIQSFSGAIQAITDAAVGIEGAGFEQVLAALIEPIANTAKQMGEMFMAEGLAIVAFQNSLENPFALIAAGAALIALGSAVSSGLAKLTANPAGSATAASAGTSSAGSSVAGGIETYEQELTVRVVGTLSGSDIILSGEKTQNKWNR